MFCSDWQKTDFMPAGYLTICYKLSSDSFFLKWWEIQSVRAQTEIQHIKIYEFFFKEIVSCSFYCTV